MADLERQVLAALGWRGPGLIGLAEADRPAGGAQEPSPGALGAGRLSPSLAAPSPRATATPGPRDIRLIALDMDGTLLDGTSSVLSSSADAIRAALARGVHVVLATGKARPAAQAALRATGIAELASAAAPGIFLQGLLVYGQGGLLLASAALDPAVVQAAFEYSGECLYAMCGIMLLACAMCSGRVWYGAGRGSAALHCTFAPWVRGKTTKTQSPNPPHLPNLSNTPQMHTEGRCVPFLGTSA